MILKDNMMTVVHPMAFPGRQNTNSMQRGEPSEKYLMDSLNTIAQDNYFGGIEITRIKDPALRKKAIDFLKSTKLHTFFGAQFVQSLNEEGYAPTDISSINELDRINGVNRLKALIVQAYEFSAEGFSFRSGRDPGVDLRDAAKLSLVRSIDELCEYSEQIAKKLKRKPMNMILIMFDRINDPRGRFHDQLIGPTLEAIEIARRLRDEYHHDEFGLLYDLTHMLLIKNTKSIIEHINLEITNGTSGETTKYENLIKEEDVEEPEFAEVLQYLKPYLLHVHIGNCVLDPNDPNYGDAHVSFAYPNGAIKLREVADFVKALYEMDYKGPIGFEVLPRGREGSVPVLQYSKSFYDDARTWQDVVYGVGKYKFVTRDYFPEWAFYKLTDMRVKNPEIIEETLKARKRRKSLTDDGYLVILAADHPARRVTGVGENPTLIGDRLEYLGRIVRVLTYGYVDGVMATPDLIDELAMVDYLYKKSGRKSFLDNKIIMGSMNRSGLAGIEYEMEDVITAYWPKDLVRFNLDAGKLLFRLDTGKYSRWSLKTLEECAAAVRECNELGLPVFMEPLPVKKENENSAYETILDADELIKIVGVVSAIGGSSAKMWIKIPYVPNFERVARSTTLPILILGGESKEDPTYTMENLSKALESGPNVRGALVGRNVLFPGDDDPAAVSYGVFKTVHDGLSAAEALEDLIKYRSDRFDELKKVFEETLG
jgi:DhnA family fructose-bisphosphate aldolase class Ia/sugar phosphate isomerase/epimerase